MIEITIFTPTFNRAYILSNLYESLKNQSSKNFIWLIVDDGSTDNTKELVDKWIFEKKIKIEYYKQKNSGKSIAHNKGVKLTTTEIFTCVDSDDFLANTAVEEIIKQWINRKKDENIIGILAFKGFPTGEKPITTLKNENIQAMTLKSGYDKYGLKGDTMLVFKTDIVAKFKFPEFKKEKFVPEAYLYDLIDQKGKLLIVRKILYFSEYLSGGYTRNMSRILASNPNGYLEFIEQRLQMDKKLKHKILDTIRYTSMCIKCQRNKYIKNSIYPFYTIITWPFAYILYLKKYKNIL